MKNKKMLQKVFTLRNSKGFTLIELLVVVAIISLLASIILASLTSARDKAKDARAMTEVRSISTALELYYNQNGAYPNPVVAGTCPNASGWYRSDVSACWTTAAQGMQGALSTWMPKLPVHPDNTNNFIYAYKPQQTGNSGYCIATLLKSSINLGNGCYPSTGGNGFCLGFNFNAGCDGGAAF